MPEKGRYSLSVRKETALRVRELAENKGLTVDEFINELMKPSSKGVWSTFSKSSLTLLRYNQLTIKRIQKLTS